MSQHVTMIGGMMDRAGNGVLSAALELLTQWSLGLGIGLAVIAVISSAMTKKVPWTREASVWLYSMAATACFAVHWAAPPV
jgi:predicted membrane channel-forming protein YqfA (hemolysin III family)